jgi:small subunit ribosomal protein S18
MSDENNDRRDNRQSGGRRRYFSRPRTCQFCSDPSIKIHYKDISLLSGFINREGKIRPRRQTGTCAKHQRKIAVAVKQARHMALLQFSGESLN